MGADIDAVLDALGDPMRRAILGRLAVGPAGVGELAAGMPIGRTGVSMHLRVLKDAGVIRDRAVGNRRIYQLEPDALRQVRDHLDWYWERAMVSYRKAAEERAGERGEAAGQEIVVAKAVRVDAPVAVAFEVFVEQGWWPVATHHLAEPPGVAVVLEPFAGGRWYERGEDGTETGWGTVLAWQPPYRLLLSWLVSPEWTVEADPARASEIEVTFTPDGPHATRVDLTHRHLERYGAGAERMRRILTDKGGEPLAAYARRVAARREEER